MKVADLRPASSPGDASFISTLKPRRSAQRRYMRRSISAQSWESVPPAPGAHRDHGVACVVAAAEQARLLERPRAAAPPSEAGRRARRRSRGRRPPARAAPRGRPASDSSERNVCSRRWAAACSADVRRGLLVVPEAGPLHLRLEPLYLGLELGGVKGSPRAASGPRGPPRAARTRSLVRRPRP